MKITAQELGRYLHEMEQEGDIEAQEHAYRATIAAALVGILFQLERLADGRTSGFPEPKDES